MPLLTLHLIRLGPFINVPAFVELLKAHSASIELIIVARPKHKIIRAGETDREMLDPRYELVLLVKRQTPFWPGEVQGSIYRDYTIHIATPQSQLTALPQLTQSLRANAPPQPSPSLTPTTTPTTATTTNALDPATLAFAQRQRDAPGAKDLLMLNLLRFNAPLASTRASYATYGRHFSRLAERRGAAVKVAGRVVEPSAAARGASWGDGGREYGEGRWWDEVSLVAYPSMDAFVDVVASDAYRQVNERYRTGALRDTFLMACKEIDVHGSGAEAKL